MVKIYYDKYGRLYASWVKRNDSLLGEVEVGDTFKILYDDTDCDGCIKGTKVGTFFEKSKKKIWKFEKKALYL